MHRLLVVVLTCVGLMASAAKTTADLVDPITGNHLPNTGYGPDSLKVNYLVQIAVDGSFHTYFDSSVGSYVPTAPNGDDRLFAVVNNSLKAYGSILVSGGVNGGQAIFAFDGDGVNRYFPPPVGTPNAPPNPLDTTGYGGPISFFTNINPAKTSGTVNFKGALAPGAQTYFALDNDINFVATAVPEPGSLFLGGVLVLSVLGGRLWSPYRTRVAQANKNGQVPFDGS
jgi:hypothetical protein